MCYGNERFMVLMVGKMRKYSVCDRLRRVEDLFRMLMVYIKLGDKLELKSIKKLFS